MEVLKRIEQQSNMVKELSIELKNENSYRGMERLIQLTLQSLLDLGLMVLSAIGMSPTGYRDVAISLGRLSLITPEDADLMRAMAGLRNILVHGYTGVNREIIVESSKKVPKDASMLADQILSSAKLRVNDPKKTRNNLTETLREVLKDRVKLAFIFGSQVKGYSLKGDVDIALYFGRYPDPYEVGWLVSNIQEKLKREDIDIMVIDDCDNITLAYEAVRGELILGEEDELLELKTKIASQYIDYKERLRHIKALLAKTS